MPRWRALPEIGHLLRHRSLSATAMYARVDVDGCAARAALAGGQSRERTAPTPRRLPAMRRALGFKLAFRRPGSAAFVAFLDAAGANTVTTELAMTLGAAAARHVQPIMLAHRLSAVRGFARWLARSTRRPRCPRRDLAVYRAPPRALLMFSRRHRRTARRSPGVAATAASGDL